MQQRYLFRDICWKEFDGLEIDIKVPWATFTDTKAVSGCGLDDVVSVRKGSVRHDYAKVAIEYKRRYLLEISWGICRASPTPFILCVCERLRLDWVANGIYATYTLVEWAWEVGQFISRLEHETHTPPTYPMTSFQACGNTRWSSANHYDT